MKDYLIAKTNPQVNVSNIIKGHKYRITVLTPRLFRIQTSKNNKFNDYATQSVWNRDFGKVNFALKYIGSLLIITTESIKFAFNISTLKPKTVHFLDTDIIEKCDNSQNLKGTRRTLDMTFGAVKLADGVVSKNGVAIFDDSKSLTLNKEGFLSSNKNSDSEIYVFAYGKNHRESVKALYKLCGNVPLIPRFALGNWWSRYKVYTQNEYIDLMQKFMDKDIPITVATLDMDWHYTDLNKEFNLNYRNKRPHAKYPCTGGWTGYSWNKNLFPDHKKMLNFLHDNNMKVTLNLHPADGVRFFEDNYEPMAKAMDIDPKSKAPVKFDISNEKFIDNYFKYLHTPLEKEGVDFWWIDWQQGNKSSLAGLDPLWALNHYHYLDNAKNGELPLILSRYAGLGSHRYPLGFSGDTFITWSTLRFQPYFTSTASNAGYTWWSHDIGGHQLGKNDEELYIRWIQFGVFSPINRLHSTVAELLGKEPWLRSKLIENLANQFLRLRHKLIPYIYTMDYRNHKDGLSLCEPIYYSYPEIEDSYKIPNEYMFGSELLVCPVTNKINKKATYASTKMYIPKGRWTDIFTGEIYDKDGITTLYRDISSIPVLAKAGAIIPLSNDKGNSVANPKSIELLIYRGNNKFDLYEDNNSINFEKNKAITTFEISENDTISFTINKIKGNTEIVPTKRTYHLVFKDINKVKQYSIIKNGEKLDKQLDKVSNNCFELYIEVANTDKITIEISDYSIFYNQTKQEWKINIFTRYQTGNLKKAFYHWCINHKKHLLTRIFVPKILRKMLGVNHG